MKTRNKHSYVFVQALFVLIIIISNSVYAADTLDIKQCYSALATNYPLNRQAKYLRTANKLRTENIGSAWLPKAELNGQATYQSDVTSIEIPFPGIKIDKPSLDQYKVSLDFSQKIYDGSQIGARKVLENSSLSADLSSVEVEIYKMKQLINQYYFAILVLQKNDEILRIKNSELEEKLKTIESAVRNGVMLPSSADALQAEILKIGQSSSDIKANISNAISALSELTGMKIGAGVVFRNPNSDFDSQSEVKRPELNYFAKQTQKLESAGELAGSQNNPKLFAFAQLGYGKPGFNMLSKDFKTFYIVGAKFTWNFWDWNSSSRDAETYKAQQGIVDISRDVFLQNLQIALNNELNNIKKYEELLSSDNDILQLRKKILKSYDSQLANGVITMTDYLSELNNEISAEINMELHKIQLLQSQVNYMFLKGAN
ncbi:MAG: TolC family protein [Bacteroidota bacterium]